MHSDRHFPLMSERPEHLSDAVANATHTVRGSSSPSEDHKTTEAVRKPEEMQGQNEGEPRTYSFTDQLSQPMCEAGILANEQPAMPKGKEISVVPVIQAEDQRISDVDEKEMRDIRDWTEFRRWRANKERVGCGETGTLGLATLL